MSTPEPMDCDTKQIEPQTLRKSAKSSLEALVKARVEGYFKQFTVGCGRPNCDNFLCVSNPALQKYKLNPTDAAVLAMNIVKSSKSGEFICEGLKSNSAQNNLSTSGSFSGSSSSNSSLSSSPELNQNSSGILNSSGNNPVPSFIDLETFEYTLASTSPTNFTPLVRLFGSVFGSLNSCAISFLKHPKKVKLDGTDFGLDFDQLRTFYAKMEDLPHSVQDCLSSAFERLMYELKYGNPHNISTLRVYLILFEYPKLLVESRLSKLAGHVMLILSSLSDQKQEFLFKNYFLELPKQFFLDLHRSLQNYITLRIIEGGGTFAPTSDAHVTSATKIIGFLYEVNKLKGKSYISGINSFCNEQVNETIDLRKNYVNWKKGRFSFCQYPFILSTEVKSKFLNIEAIIAQRQLREETIHMLAQGIVDDMPLPYFVVRVRRSHLIEDSIDSIRALILIDPNSLKKQLRVEFSGEEGIDEGGVKKEWFQLIVQDLFSLKYGMFTENEETRTHWFNQRSQDFDAFELLGILLGLAIYNNVILDLHFPIFVYKKLCGMPPTLADLTEIDPGLGRGLSRLLQLKGDVSSLDLNYQIQYDYFGTVETHNLIPNGDQIPLTNQADIHRYVELYVNYLLHESVELQFQAFKKGFDAVMSLGPAMKLFEPEELQLVICGSPELNFAELEKETHYDNGYSKDHPTIRYFWDVLHSMTLDEKKKFLFFTTGSDRSPIGGLGKLHLVITRQAAAAGTDRLPTSHTCFNHLILPEYESKKKLDLMLKKAIANSTGFGLM